MAIVLVLPPESLIHILSFLPIRDILVFRSVCKHFDAVVQDNSETVFKQAAILHKYIFLGQTDFSPNTILHDHAKSPSPHSSVQNWLHLCKAHWRIDRGWREGKVVNDSTFYSPNSALLGNIYSDGEFLLLPRLHNAGIHPLYIGTHALSYPQRKNVFSSIIRTSSNGTLKLSNDGFYLFQVRPAVYELWSNPPRSKLRQHTAFSYVEPGESPDRYPSEIAYHARMELLGEITLDGYSRSMKLKHGCLMMVSTHNTLYIFDLSVFSCAEGESEPTAASGQNPEAEDGVYKIQPTVTADISDHSHYGTIPYTVCIDFDAEYIFHSTNMGFRILSRKSLHEVYSISDVPWLKVAPGRWVRSFTPHTFVLDIPKHLIAGPRWFAPPPIIPKSSSVHTLQRGVSSQKRYQSWSWDTRGFYVKDGMIVIAYSDGWLVGFPDYQKLINKTWCLEDEGACWTLDLGTRRCDGMFFDGRRVVCNLPDRFVILNLHETSIERSLNTYDRTITADTKVTCVQHDEILSTTEGSMFLTERDMWVCAAEHRGGSSFRLIGWRFSD